MKEINNVIQLDSIKIAATSFRALTHASIDTISAPLLLNYKFKSKVRLGCKLIDTLVYSRGRIIFELEYRYLLAGIK